VAGVALVLPACAHLQRDAGAALPPVAPLHVLFVADGAGDFQATSKAVRDTAAADGWPLDVHTVVWSHGYLRILADHTDYASARARGRDLAALVLTQRQARPDLPVSLMAHSDGSAVVLAAAEDLPPDTLDRIVLLAPAVSSDYDVRPALRATRGGVDVFYSRNDRLWLGLFSAMVGSVDDPGEARVAGRFGFEPPAVLPEDVPLYGKLHQYAWNPTLEQVGHDGGHFGAYQSGHLRRFVLPLFQY
jgi:hypothetical protein